MSVPRWNRFAALGDSITEGWCDPVAGDDEPWLGWADRLALRLDAALRPAGRRLEFANLAVRGRRVRHVVEDQIPASIELGADLVSVLVGSNDLARVRADPDAVAAQLETGVARLRANGTDVLLATAFDPAFSRVLRPLRRRAAVYAANLGSIAQRHGCIVLDLWGMPGLADRSMWSPDRVHPSTRGHIAIARAAAASLGLDEEEPLNVATPQQHLPTTIWLRRHLAPWVSRRLRGVSSGDGLGPKLPEPVTTELLIALLQDLHDRTAGAEHRAGSRAGQ